jgi:hypothetical protein
MTENWNVYEAYGKMIDALTDSDGVDALNHADTEVDRALKMAHRAEHLRDVLTAALDYAEQVLDDTYHGTGRHVRLTEARECVNRVCDRLAADAEKLSPGGAAVGLIVEPVEIEKLVNGSLSELVGKSHQDLALWARDHGVRGAGMAAFWRVFTVALFKRGKTFHEMSGATNVVTGEKAPPPKF